MDIENRCRACGKCYDGHWHYLPKDSKPWDVVPCPKCGSKNVHTMTDESNNDPCQYYEYADSFIEEE